MKYTKKLLEDIGYETTFKMIQILESKNKNASGNLSKSITYDVKEMLGELTLSFSQEDYGEFVDRGRKKGKFAPISKIKQWCSIRGIPQSAAYAINNKIFRFGIKPTNFMLPLFEIEKKFFAKAESAFTKDVEIYIDENIIRGLK